MPVDMADLRPSRKEDTPKRTYLKKYHFEEHGYTDGCEGCARSVAVMEAKPHTEECRRRMYEAMRKTEKGRKWLEKADDRIDEYMELEEKQRENE